MAREDPLFRLRMPEDLKATLQQAAKRNHRSLNAEIVARLESTVGVDVSGVSEPHAAYHLLNQHQADLLGQFIKATRDAAMAPAYVSHQTNKKSTRSEKPDKKTA